MRCLNTHTHVSAPTSDTCDSVYRNKELTTYKQLNNVPTYTHMQAKKDSLRTADSLATMCVCVYAVCTCRVCAIYNIQ